MRELPETLVVTTDTEVQIYALSTSPDNMDIKFDIDHTSITPQVAKRLVSNTWTVVDGDFSLDNLLGQIILNQQSNVMPPVAVTLYCALLERIDLYPRESVFYTRQTPNGALVRNELISQIPINVLVAALTLKKSYVKCYSDMPDRPLLASLTRYLTHVSVVVNNEHRDAFNVNFDTYTTCIKQLPVNCVEHILFNALVQLKAIQSIDNLTLLKAYITMYGNIPNNGLINVCGMNPNASYNIIHSMGEHIVVEHTLMHRVDSKAYKASSLDEEFIRVLYALVNNRHRNVNTRV